MTRHAVLTILALVFATTRIQAQRIKDSNTVLPIAQQTTERSMKLNPNACATVTGSGTDVGISVLLDETADVAMASRGIKFNGKMKAKATEEELAGMMIVYDALAAVVHPSNPVKQLTCRQLEDISRGKITNWKQVSGNDRKVMVYSHETSSGIHELFKESMLRSRGYMNNSFSIPATGAIIQSINQARGTVGYVRLVYISPRTKILAISYDGKHFATFTLENAISKTYPIVRPLYYYHDKRKSDQTAPLLQFILSPVDQEITRKGEYIPVNR